MNTVLSMIPLSSLQPSKKNVRKTGRATGIEPLAASIEAHGLLQNLTVRNCAGAKQDKYEVIAGGRRLAALKFLAKRKKIARDMAVPCRVLNEADTRDTELSLAENEMRAPVHPADQFEAFSKLQTEGQGSESIAAHFGISASVVEQRLKLSAVSPRLMAAFRDDEMSLDQLMAFAISDDREAQERVWFEHPGVDRTPGTIRRALTSTLVEAADRRARFVGAEAYEGAGGTVLRDLFRPEDEGYFTDSTLLDRLVAEKLAGETNNVKAEGWKWVEVRTELDYEYLARFGRLPPDIEPLSDEEQKRLTKLGERYDKLVAELDDDPSDKALAEIDTQEEEIDGLSVPREVWDESAKARGGTFVALDYEGDLVVVRGLVAPDPDAGKGARKKKGSRTKRGGISDSLREELSAYRTAALRVELSRDPQTAFRALLHALVLRTFYRPSRDTCLDVRPAIADLRSIADGIAESTAMQAFAEQHAAFGKGLPKKPETLWEWLGKQAFEANLDLLAHCAAGTINALWRRRENAQEGRLAQADMLASAVELDMASWWQVDRVGYFDHVSKDAILEAVAEGASKQAANNIGSLKKGAMAMRAEELLKDSGWLPEPLRSKATG